MLEASSAVPREGLRVPPGPELPFEPEDATGAGTSEGARSAGGTLEVLRLVAAWLVLPNAGMFLVARIFAVQRGLVNADYVLGPLALLVAGPRVARIAVALLLGLDALAALAPVYHFQPADAFLALTEVPELSWRFAAPIALVAAAAGWGLARTLLGISGPRVTLRALATLGLVLVGVVAADAFNGTSLLSGEDQPVRSHRNLATSASVQLVGRLLPRPRAAPPTAPRATESAAAALAVGGGLRGENVLLVLVESLGAYASGRAADEQLLAPLLGEAVRARYEVKVGTVPFAGATTPGEFRELCGAAAGPGDLERIRTADCLPAVLRRAGYATLAVHGHSPHTFGRSDWYPRLGFDSAYFAPQLTARGFSSRCGFSFRGVCDADALSFVRQRLRDAAGPTFVYWLTLSSHVPVDVEAAAATPASCGAISETARDASACLLFRVHTGVVRGVAAMLADPSLPPMRVVLVGDHPPPFLQPGRRALYLRDRVAYVVLTPRTAPAGPAAREAR